MSDKSILPSSSADSKNTQKRKNRKRSLSSLSSRSSRKKAPEQASEQAPIHKEEEEVCCICMESLKGRKTKYTLSECEHIIHKECLNNVCKTKAECPLCRSDIRADCREILGCKKNQMPGHIITKIRKYEKYGDLLLYNKINEERIAAMTTYMLQSTYPRGTKFSEMQSFGSAILEKDRR